GHQYLVNIHGRGYRFVAPVSLEDRQSPRPQQRLVQRHSHNLPNQITRLVGRADTSRALATFLSSDRLLTIVGPGGIGKTSIALAVANELAGSYEQGVWLAALARIADPDMLPRVLGSVLGLDTLSGTTLPVLARSLRGRQMLLVLDNCEHAAEAAASFAVHMLQASSGARNPST